MNKYSSSSSRRDFLKKTGLSIAMPTIIPASAIGRDGKKPANERIQVGVVGLGSRGFDLLKQFMEKKMPGLLRFAMLIHCIIATWNGGRAKLMGVNLHENS